MNHSRQRDQFLAGEGDAWFERNRRIVPHEVEADDPLLPSLLQLPLPAGEGTVVAEVGCGQGLRLEALARRKGWCVSGLDPSTKAVTAASHIGIDAVVGTADKLPYADQSIDLLIFGFCLYLCDRDDLFRIAAEAHRVLKSSSWLAILDFWSPYPRSNPYCHRDGVLSHKTTPSSMFEWHPSYVITDHQLRHHGDRSYTDDADEWIAITLLRRCDPPRVLMP